MNGKVTSRQLTNAAVVIIMTTSLLTKQLYMYTQNDAWVAVLAATLVCLVIYKIYAALASKFPGQTLSGINDAVFGPIVGKLVTGLYIYFFLSIAAFNINVIGSFINTFVLPSTPTLLVLVLFIAVCAWAVQKGAENIMRYSVLFTVATILIIVVNALILIPNYDLKNFLPALHMPMIRYVVGTHSLAMIPLSDPIVLLVFLPILRKPESFGRAMSRGLLIGAAVLLVIVLRDIVVQGSYTQMDSFPSFSTIRMIDIGDIITRMEIIYSAVLIALIFYKVAVFFYAVVTSVQNLLNFNSYRFLTKCLAVLLIIFATAEFTSASEHSSWLTDGSAAIHHTFFVVFLPLMTLVVAVLRGHFKNREAAAQ